MSSSLTDTHALFPSALSSNPNIQIESHTYLRLLWVACKAKQGIGEGVSCSVGYSTRQVGFIQIKGRD